MAEKKEKVGFFASIKKHLREVKSEMKKIVWPTKSQVVNNTLIVIAVSLIAAVLIFGLDTVFGLVLQLIYKNV
ncbi:MAG: preprotein translocase subunit SecE [Oscillospiraceae bacterium]|nr:preprotein translocase subunit SecE [Oscillospiraceae bacterium]